MLSQIQGFTYNKFEKPTDWPKLDKTFDYKLENGKLLSGNEHIYLSGPVTYEVVGNPTIVDGIVSGFSANNLLKTSQSVPPQNITERTVKIKLNSSAIGSAKYHNVFFGPDDLSLVLYGGSSGAQKINLISCYMPGIGTSMNWIDADLVANTWYWLKYTYDGSTAKLYFSTDGINYGEEKCNYNGTISGSAGIIKIGTRWNGDTDYFDGQIDINETYIKVNNQLWFYGKNYATKNIVPVPAGFEYNNTITPSIGWVNTNTSSEFQQFTAAPEGVSIGKDETEMLQVEGGKVVGSVTYTTQGNPSIINGIASGFSINNYLKLSNNFTPGSYAWEIKFKVMTGNNVQNHYDFFGSSNDTDWKHIGIGTQNAHFKIYLSSTGSRWDIGISEGSHTISVNTSYYLKLIYNTASYQLFVSTDNENWTNDITIQNATPIYQNSAVQAIGANRVGGGNYYWPGSIDLNETYIKVNNVLWFGKEDWTPSTYTDNAIYLLGSHSTDYSNYNTLEFTPTVSDDANYDVWIDNQKLFENENGGTSINWQNLGLTTGYSITTPSTLKAHTIKITPTNSSKSIIGFNTKTDE